MEKVKTGSLRTEFSAAVTVTLLIVVFASAITVWGCWAVRHRILPESNKVALTIEETSADGKEHQGSYIELTLDGGEEPVIWMSHEMTTPDMINESGLLVGEADFSVESIEASVSQLGPRERVAYMTLGVLMGALPVIYAIVGVLFCALWFYRKRLAPAISVLDEATRHISEQDLDFSVECPLNNELGRLCASFEEMRMALYDNNLKLWRSIEERRTMQASVAHDLRNPLAIMAGIVEQLRESAAAGKLTDEKLSASLTNLASTTSRMENYTNYIRDLDAIEDTEVNFTEAALPDFLREAAGGVEVLAEARGLEITTSCDVPVCKVGLDKEIFYRVLENVFSNAVRYARSHIELEFALRKESLFVRVSDDGPGFSKEILKKKQSLYYSEDPTGEHMGLGLATSRILCAKHGGALKLSNIPNCGASVEITFAVK